MKNLKFIFLLTSILYFTACQDNTTSTHSNIEQSTVVYQRVSNADFKQLMTKFPDAHLVDVRTSGEYASGYIGTAKNIDYKGSNFKNKINALDKSKPVLVYCQAGGRSKKACTMMKGMGFTEIYELKNGYENWQ